MAAYADVMAGRTAEVGVEVQHAVVNVEEDASVATPESIVQKWFTRIAMF